MYILGMDIGYSNVKLAWGDDDEGIKPEIAVYPAGVAPINCISESMATNGYTSGLKIVVEGVEYVAGIEQSTNAGLERVQSEEDRHFSIDYKALFYASLMATGREEIGILVTGLPGEQCADKDYRERVEKHLQGRHEIAPGHFVFVHKVIVIPHSLGAYVDYLMTCEDPRVARTSRVLVIDPGFFSVDYCVIDKGAFDRASSGSSQAPIGVLLENAEKMAAIVHGQSFELSSIKAATRGEVLTADFGKRVNLAPYLSLAATNVAEPVLSKILQKLRPSIVKGVDFTILAGGGADLYKEPASTIMEGSQVLTVLDPVTTFAKGFFEYGRG